MNTTQNMQIYTIIGQIEDVLESSQKPKIGGGPTKRIIDIEELKDLLGDLKVTIPDDIRRANSVIVESATMLDNASENAKDLVDNAQKKADDLIAQANATSERIVEKAKQEYERLVSEDEIYQEAQKRAQLLAMKAEHNAALVYENAKCYANDVLLDLENFLNEYRQLVDKNRCSLEAKQPAQPVYQQPVQQNVARQEAPAPAPVRQQRKPKPPVARPAPVEEPPVEEEYEEETRPEKKSLFGWLKKDKNVNDFEFDDDDEFDN